MPPDPSQKSIFYCIKAYGFILVQKLKFSHVNFRHEGTPVVRDNFGLII